MSESNRATVDAEEACIACEAPFKPDDLVLADVEGGFLHAACCGPERESYVHLDDGSPLAEGEPIPTPFRWDSLPQPLSALPVGEAPQEAPASPDAGAVEPQIKAMVNRFLSWPLPNDFAPDAGVSFTPNDHQRGAYAAAHWPVGTNLLTAQQAEAMVRHMLAASPPPAAAGEVERLRAGLRRIADAARPIDGMSPREFAASLLGGGT